MGSGRSGTRRFVASVVAGLLAASLQGSLPRSLADSRLESSRDRVASLAARIDTAAHAADELRTRLAESDERVAEAEQRAALTLARRLALSESLERAHAAYERARDRLNDVATRAFMAAAGPDAAVVDAFLGAESIADVGDRLAYSAAISQADQAIADDVLRRRTTLDATASSLDALLTRQRAVSNELQLARDERAAALADQLDLMAHLDAIREVAVRTVERLRDRVSAGHLRLLTDALQGSDHVSYGAWSELFLRMVGAPVCRSNRVVVVSWQVQEFTQAAWNPLATTHGMPGSWSFNSVGVQNFVSLEQGLRATEQTIEHGWGVYGYGAIVEDLRRCAEPEETARAIAASSWCPGCLNGMYVLGVVPKVDADLATYAAL
jgi:hypothetical protein